MPRNKYHDTPVVEFHEAFGAPISWQPRVPDEERRKLRCSLLLEEVLEFCEASGFKVTTNHGHCVVEPETVEFTSTGFFNIASAADALADIQYVTDGASLEWGIPLAKIFREVHRSNMSKLGADGKPLLRADGKILKGPHYTPPAVADILKLYEGLNNGF